MVKKTRKTKKLPRGESFTFLKNDKFLDRDLQWLEFNRRVLNEAQDERSPLLERVKFLGIFSSNLDEFFMKRMSWLLQIVEMNLVSEKNQGVTSRQHLAEIKNRILSLRKEQADCWEKLLPLLTAEGIFIHTIDQLNPEQKDFCANYFRKNIFSVLTPLAVDPGHPFPFMSNLSTSLAVVLRHPGQEDNLFSRIKIPKNFNQLIRIDLKDNARQFHFIRLRDIIRANVQDLFPNMTVLDVMPFRITRNVDISWEEDDAENLLEMVSEEVRLRKFGEVVRLEHDEIKNEWILEFLKNELDLPEEVFYSTPGELDFNDLKIIGDLAIPHLKYKNWTPVIPQAFTDSQDDLFQVIRAGDVLVHHPYESFVASVENFLESASVDPKVLAIKMTLYRTGEESPFIPLLIRAAEMGKEVVCVVELKARFDEERNIFWARKLEKAGVHVVYGIVGLKTHMKTALVVRQDGDALRCYAHIGTGNYHKGTASLYDDFGLFTCDPKITEELVELFHYLTGRSLKRNYQNLLVAPINMKERFLELINQEAENAKAGKPARIITKCNSLEDPTVIEALYAASSAGVSIDLIVRGFCCLRPGLKGLSENIRVQSVIGRFLEHSRIYYFARGMENPLEGDFYISSADWMYRNLHARVELAAPVMGRPQRERIWEVLTLLREDNRQAWDMFYDGTYLQRKAKEGEVEGVQSKLMDLAKKRIQVQVDS